MMKTHTFIARVEDKPGVLNRIASLFRRRGFNIASLTVGRPAEPGVSRLTLVIEADEDTARRIEANLYKLVNVLLVEDVTYQPSIARELALIKVRADATTRSRVLEMVRTGVGAMTRGAPTPISNSSFREVNEVPEPQGTSQWPASSTTATLISDRSKPSKSPSSATD